MKCDCCGLTYDTEEIAGYNYRWGKVLDVLCKTCMDFHVRPTNQMGSFETAWKRIRRLRPKPQNKGKVGVAWRQERML